MGERIQVKVTQEEQGLPDCPAVYAIFSANKCRFVGVTYYLQKRITGHFSPCEPNISLRYFMLSSKSKTLLYELIDEGSLNCIDMIRETWVGLYSPSDNEPSVECSRNPVLAGTR